jgi:hypothetical protein
MANLVFIIGADCFPNGVTCFLTSEFYLNYFTNYYDLSFLLESDDSFTGNISNKIF